MLFSFTNRSTCRLHFSASFVQQIHFLATVVSPFSLSLLLRFVALCVSVALSISFLFYRVTAAMIRLLRDVGHIYECMFGAFIHQKHTNNPKHPIVRSVDSFLRSFAYLAAPNGSELSALILPHWRITCIKPAHIKAKQRNAINIYLSAILQFVQCSWVSSCVDFFTSN